MRLYAFGALAPALCLSLGLFSPLAAHADTLLVGNDVVARSIVDTCTSCSYVIGQAFTAGERVDSFSFFAGTLAGTVTPLIFARTNPTAMTATFEVVGVGTQRTPTALGLNTFAFDTVSGSNLTGTDFYFGFENNSGGVVDFDYTFAAGGDPFTNTTIVNGGTYFVFHPVVYGESFTGNVTTSQPNTQFDRANREYSIAAYQATPAVPEPTTLSLLALGISSLGAVTRFKRR